jgi:hypothetical protein
MSQVDEERLSETEAEQDAGLSGKLVPVTESIRYRKRAQSAEKKNEELSAELEQTKAELSEAAEQLESIRCEQELARKLLVAGATDLEAAVLLAKSRLKGNSESDLDGCIEKLKKEKQYLFAKADTSGAAVRKTSGVKSKAAGQSILEQAAKKAAGSGDRRDLQEYLKLRRNVL